MKQRNEYSRIIQNVHSWNQQGKGGMIGLLHACVETGITTFDVTDFQGKHAVGTRFGAALSESGLSRDEIQLVARVGEPLVDVLEEKVDDLLLELGIDYLDLLFLGHSPKPEATLRALEAMLSRSKLHEIGNMGVGGGSQEKELEGSIVQTSFMLLSQEILTSLEVREKNGEKLTLFVDWSREQTDLLSYGTAFDVFRDKYRLNHKELLLVWLLQHPLSMHLVLEGVAHEEIERYGVLREVILDSFDWQQINLIFTG